MIDPTERRHRRNLSMAWRDLQKASAARRKLAPGSSRARVTTANARWRSASEEWARCCDQAVQDGFGHLVEEVMSR